MRRSIVELLVYNRLISFNRRQTTHSMLLWRPSTVSGETLMQNDWTSADVAVHMYYIVNAIMCTATKCREVANVHEMVDGRTTAKQPTVPIHSVNAVDNFVEQHSVLWCTQSETSHVVSSHTRTRRTSVSKVCSVGYQYLRSVLAPSRLSA